MKRNISSFILVFNNLLSRFKEDFDGKEWLHFFVASLFERFIEDRIERFPMNFCRIFSFSFCQEV